MVVFACGGHLWQLYIIIVFTNNNELAVSHWIVD